LVLTPEPFLSLSLSSGEYWGEMGFARIAAGKNMLGIEDHVAWVTPGTFTVENVPCSEDGKICGNEIQNHGTTPTVRKFVGQSYVDPSAEFIAKKEASYLLQSSLRIKK
jgi:hypothetical protein